MTQLVTAVIRAKDKADTIGDAIASLTRQTTPVEVVVVDSGSEDQTLEIASRMGAKIVTISSASFSYGGAINTGVAASSAEYLLILSAHAVLPSDRWLEVALQHFGDSLVAGVNGAVANSRAKRNRALSAEQRLIVGELHDIVVQDRAFRGFVGFSNTASLVRRSVCVEFPFDEEMIACEDKEWANRVTQAGHRIVFDPALAVSGAHRQTAGYRSLYRRARNESAALTAMLGEPAWTMRIAAQHLGLVFAGRAGITRLAPFRPANLVENAARLSGARRATRTQES
jgi:rhamnosyltransferase